MNSMKFKHLAAIVLLGAALSGCSTVKGWFTSKDAAAKKALEPAELVDFTPTVKVRKLWSTGVGNSAACAAGRAIATVSARDSGETRGIRRTGALRTDAGAATAALPRRQPRRRASRPVARGRHGSSARW